MNQTTYKMFVGKCIYNAYFVCSSPSFHQDVTVFNLEILY